MASSLANEADHEDRASSWPLRALVTGGDLTEASDVLLDALAGEVKRPISPAFRLHLQHGSVTLVSCGPDGEDSGGGVDVDPCVRPPAGVEETPSEYLSETVALAPGVARRWTHPAHVELFGPNLDASRPVARFTMVPHLPTDAARASALKRLMESLPPRTAGILHVLVLPQPVESAGPTGQGGRYASAVFHRLPAPLRAQIEGGYFDLVLASGDAGAQWNGDISDAIARSSKVWIQRPLAQLVIDGMRHPSPARRGTPWTRGTSLRPQLFSQHLGFARVDLFDGSAAPTLVIFRGHRWLEAHAPSPVDPSGVLPARRAVPSMAPCRDCDEASGRRPPS